MLYQFFNRLKRVMTEIIKIKEPKGLLNDIAAVIRMRIIIFVTTVI